MCTDCCLSPIGMLPIVSLEAGSFTSATKDSFQMFALCRYTAFLLNEAKPVVQRQSVNKRLNTKKGFINSCKHSYLKRCEERVRSGEKWGWRGCVGCTERKSASVSREGKRSHSRWRYFFPPGRLLWSGEEFWLRLVWSLIQWDPVQMASSLSAGTVADAQQS